jgi:hypothetical protein
MVVFVVLFAGSSRRQAVIAVFVRGTLFLPVVYASPTAEAPGMPEPLYLPG